MKDFFALYIAQFAMFMYPRNISGVPKMAIVVTYSKKYLRTASASRTHPYRGYMHGVTNNKNKRLGVPVPAGVVV